MIASADNSSADVTVVVLTLNEEREIGECLAAAPRKIPMLVVDSGSTDRSVEIAMSSGATVARRAWTGFADQRNFALRECDVTTEWVLFIDADERFSTEFYEWMSGILPTDPPVDAFEIPSVLIMDGQALKFAPGYPILHPRLVRRSVVFRVNHAGHGEAVEPCRTALSPHGYDHHFHSGDLAPWLSKHVALAALEADAADARPSTARGRLARRLPRGSVRVLARFLYHFVFKLGFLDGAGGYRYALMYAWYELTVYLVRTSRRGR